MDEQWMPGNKRELMSAIKREWKLLMDVANKLTDDQMTRPDAGGWSPKDNLAHLSEWMRTFMGLHLDNRPAPEVLGVSEEVTRGWDIDVINRVLFERNRNRPAEDVMTELKQVYQSLLERLDSMNFEDMLAPRHADDPEKRPLLLWILGDTTEHFPEHRMAIEKAIKG